PGPTSVHVTFLDPAGNELPVSALVVTAASPRSGPNALKVIRFGAGYFAAEGTLPSDEVQLQITASLAAEQLRTSLPIRLCGKRDAECRAVAGLTLDGTLAAVW